MKRGSRSTPRRLADGVGELGRPSLSAVDAATLVLSAGVGTAWLAVSTGRFAPGSFFALFASLLAWWAAGTVLASSGPLLGLFDWTLPAVLVLGYTAVNTSLLVLALVTPFSVLGNFALVAAAALTAAALSRPRLGLGGKCNLPGALTVLVALVGATLWTRDTLQPIEPHGPLTLIKPWVDGFFHAIQIRMFGDTHGWSGIQDVRLAGVPAHVYHFASYLTPAFVRAGGELPGYQVFAGLYVPLGLFMSGLGAAVLVGSWWGRWAGVGGAAALMLFPDGFQLGGGNPFLGYHWMQQVGPAGAYAVAILALAWAILLGACREGRWSALVAAWVLGGVVVAYKAQFFVASALLLWMFPPIVFGTVPRRARLAWAGGALALYVILVTASQHIPGIPVIRLDGSSTGQFNALVFQWALPGPVTNLFAGILGPAQSWSVNVLCGAAYLLVAVLGIWLLAWLALSVVASAAVERVPLLFPGVVVANFLVMALGLAMGGPGRATVEELLHRPFVLAYFAAVSWTGGIAVKYLLQDGPTFAARRVVTVMALGVALAIPLATDRRVQALERMRVSYLQIPSGFVQASTWLRTNARQGEVIQDSGFDPIFLESGLSDLQPYVNGTIMQVEDLGEETRRRVAQVIELRKARDRGSLVAMARSLGIDWFVLNSGDPVWWPSEVVDHPAFESGGVRVYRLR